MAEVWRDIPGFEGYYQASILGKIKSLKGKEKLLKPFKTNKGYYKIKLYGKHYFVHRLVALTFSDICGEHLPGYEVNHLDEDTTNNVATNLRWVSHITNINWGGRNNKVKQKLSNRKDQSKLVYQYSLSGELIAQYPSANEAARQTGFYQGNISRCCRGQQKTANGYIWKYKNPTC